MFVASRCSFDQSVTTFAPFMDMKTRLRRRLRRSLLARDIHRYRLSRPEGYEPFSDDRTEYCVDLVKQLPCSDVLNLHWIAGYVGLSLALYNYPQPLHVYVCEQCLLVQLQEFSSPVEIFGAYAYFSSYSDSWLQHAQTYVDRMVDLLKLNSKSQVVEIASNDGSLLQYFVARSVPVLGIEPAANVAQQALKNGL